MSVNSGERSPPATHASAGDAARLPELDGLRALAISLVVAVHFFVPEPNSWLSKPVHFLLSMGWLGVDLFFVLSGYLITGILLRQRQHPRYFREFYFRRAMRIFPIYYLILGLGLLQVGVVHGWDAVRLDELLALLSYTQNWWIALQQTDVLYQTDPLWHFSGHLWSLSIEEQFYVFWPLLVLVLARPGFSRWLALLYASILLVKICLWVNDVHLYFLYFSTITRMDALLLGSYLATREQEGSPWRPGAGTVAALGVLVASIHLLVVAGDFTKTEAMTVESVWLTIAGAAFFAALLAYLRAGGSRSRLGVIFRSRQVRYLAAISYALYLVHAPAIQFAWLVLWEPWVTAHQLGGNLVKLVNGLIALTLSLLAAVLLHHAVERPMLAWRDRLERRWGWRS